MSQFPWGKIKDGIFDMDGTLLDLHFDNWVWEKQFPLLVSQRRNISFCEAKNFCRSVYEGAKGDIKRYNTGYWSEETGIDATGFHRDNIARIAIHVAFDRFMRLANQIPRRIILTDASHDTLGHKQEHLGSAFFGHFQEVISTASLGYTKDDPRCWQALNTWLQDHKKPPVDWERASMIDDRIKILEVCHDNGIPKDHLVWIRKPSSQGPEQADENKLEIPSVKDIGELCLQV